MCWETSDLAIGSHVDGNTIPGFLGFGQRERGHFSVVGVMRNDIIKLYNTLRQRERIFRGRRHHDLRLRSSSRCESAIGPLKVGAGKNVQ